MSSPEDENFSIDHSDLTINPPTNPSNAKQRGSARRKSVHQCPVPECARVFGTSGHLNRHIRTHTREQPHACPWPGCPKRCSRLDNLMQHYRTHAPKNQRGNKAYVRKAYADMRASLPSIPSPESDDSSLSLFMSVAFPDMIMGESHDDEHTPDTPIALSIPVSVPSPLPLKEEPESPPHASFFALGSPEAPAVGLPEPIETLQESEFDEFDEFNLLDTLDYLTSMYQLPSPPVSFAPPSLDFQLPTISFPFAPVAAHTHLTPHPVSYRLQWPNFPPPSPTSTSFLPVMSLGSIDCGALEDLRTGTVG